MEQQERTDSIFNITVDQETKSLLKTASVWAKIIAIVSFIQVAVSLVSPFLGMDRLQAMGSFFSAMIIGLVSVLVNIFLYRFAKRTADGINSSNQTLFAEGINDLKNYFKVLGIVIIILMGIVIISVIVGIMLAIG